MVTFMEKREVLELLAGVGTKTVKTHFGCKSMS